MKKNIFYLILFSLLIITCEKKDIPIKLPDPRDKYIGNWQLTNTYQIFYYNGTHSPKNTYIISGTIEKDESDASERMLIIRSSNYVLHVDIDTADNLTGCGLKGKFIDEKSLEFNYNDDDCSTALGAYQVYDVTGIKK